MARILIAGAGLMGSSLAKCLASRGVEVYVYNRTIEKAMSTCRETGCGVVEDLGSVSGMDASIIFLFDDEAVLGFTHALIEAGSLRGAGILMNSSTISPETSLLLSKLVVDHGGVYFESPVYGSTGEASLCSLVTLLAGRQELAGKAREVASLYSSRVYWVGEVPKAMALKLALNNIGLSMPAILAESLALLNSYGVDPGLFSEIAGGLWFGEVVKRYMDRINAPPGKPRFTISGAAKDYRVISTTLLRKGYPPLVSQAIASFYTLAARELPGEDYPRAVQAYLRKTVERR